MGAMVDELTLVFNNLLLDFPQSYGIIYNFHLHNGRLLFVCKETRSTVFQSYKNKIAHSTVSTTVKQYTR